MSQRDELIKLNREYKALSDKYEDAATVEEAQKIGDRMAAYVLRINYLKETIGDDEPNIDFRNWW